MRASNRAKRATWFFDLFFYYFSFFFFPPFFLFFPYFLAVVGWLTVPVRSLASSSRASSERANPVHPIPSLPFPSNLYIPSNSFARAHH